MTAGQKKTVKVLLLAIALLFAVSAGLLGWEFYSLTLNDSATISETFWVIWAHQPGPIALVLMVGSFVCGALFGHFAWQSSKVYDDIRAGKR